MNSQYMHKNLLLFLFLFICFCGCSKKDNTCPLVDNVPDTTYVTVSEQVGVCLFNDKYVLIDAYVDSAVSYLWSPTGDTTSSIVVSQPGDHSVVVFTLTTSFYWTTGVRSCGQMFVPNSFTPNGDGINDIWLPRGTGIACFYMEIRNADGILVYSTSDINKPWNGRINGGDEIGPVGFYLYYIEFSFQTGDKRSERIGSLELIR